MSETEASRRLLIAWHSRTGASETMARAAAEGAGDAILLRCDKVEPDAILAAGGYLFCCPENLATMSGAMKEMFDRCYYPVLGRIEGRPFATIIAAGSDGDGAQRQIDRIAQGWRLKRVAERMIVNFSAQTPEAILAPKTVDSATLGSCRELGEGLATGLAEGIF
ncbi:flavodoxin family protein [Erythrobacter sp. HL-111]|uniref:flavodoxin family protein n=1 Tax=Erythrobacter sp. HL-111 TaxID=1798193 RepID=UPI00087BDD2A|nr:NAD(P)H-dependent oxidoreductase [Erythrobacter sp. HL-111]SDR88243.1 NADPH-dependent FMN reductase [Erythrobacter sp. HL-111]